jgi:DNA repair protein RadC
MQTNKLKNMNLQYISDNQGKTTGVFIPIQDWEALKSKYSDLEKEEGAMVDIPEEHKNIVRQRMEASEKDPSRLLNWDDAKHKLKL